MRIGLLICMFITIVHFGLAQNIKLVDKLRSKEKSANALFEEYLYQEAALQYQQIYKGDTTRKDMALLAGDCYRLSNDYLDAEDWYAIGLSGHEPEDPVYLLHYAQSLSSNEKYDLAKEWFHKYAAIEADDIRVLKHIKSLNQLHFYFQDSQAVDMKQWSINTTFAEWAPAYYDNQIVYISNRADNKKLKNVLDWDVDSYNDIFITQENEDGSMKEPIAFHAGMNSDYHEGPLVFYDKNKIIFTQNGSDGEKGGGHLVLYTALLDDNKEFLSMHQLNLADSNHSVAHPAITPDNQTLYFSSNMPGGYGNSDLYKSTWQGDKWGQPVNLGPEINTSGNESFPFAMNQDELVFSSNGHGGLGGRDLFRVDFSLEHVILENLGYPYNSSKDDFGYISNEVGSEGYLTSNRRNGGADDDIYRFRLLWVAVEFLVVDDHDGKPLNEAEVKIYRNDELMDVRFTNKNGILDFASIPSENYLFEITKNGYEKHTYHLHTDPSDAGTLKEIDAILNRVEIVSTVKVDSTDFSSYSKFYNKERLILRLEDKIYEYREIGDYKYLVAGDEKILLGKVATDESMTMKERAHDLIKAAGMELQEDFEINNVYFDLNVEDFFFKYRAELDVVAEVLKASQRVKVEINAFSDSRGSYEYNNELTFKRAQTVARYFMSKGVQGSRFFINGYGEQGILNGCDGSKECTEIQHAINRRVEFNIILK
jgi:outer membrane protein OmpA-like peptidoglycan-associated protein